MTTPVPQNAYLVSNATGTVHPTVIFDRAPNSTDFNWPITQRWINKAANNQEYFLLNFTSSNGVVTPNWVILNAGSSGSGVQFLEGDSGGQVPPDGTSTINLLGIGSITTAGDSGTNTITTQLFGLVTHNVLVGVSPDTIGNIPNAIDVGIPLISQGGISDPSFGTALVIGGGTGTTSFTADGVVITGPTPISPLSSVTLNNGQLPIGSTGSAPVAANLTSIGGTITITNGAGSINLEASGSTGISTITTPDSNIVVPIGGNVNFLQSGGITITGSGNNVSFTSVGGGFKWNEVVVLSTIIAPGNGYVANNVAQINFSLPLTANFGDYFIISGFGSGGWRLNQNVGQSIIVGNFTTTLGLAGNIQSTKRYDSIEILCVVADTVFKIQNWDGNPMVT